MNTLIAVKKIILRAPLILGLSMALPACAEKPESPKLEESKAPNSASVEGNTLGESVKSTIMAKLSAARPDLQFTDVRATEVPELFEVEFNGGNIVYATASGDFFVVGEIYNVTPTGIVNITEKKKSGARVAAIEALESKDLISFAPKGETKAEIFVFTDVDCGYCRKLHQEIPELNELGIKVSYLAFPRAGFGSDSYNRMASAWCSEDKLKAMDTLKNGGSIPLLACNENPVKEQYLLGQELGVTGTPAIILSDGSLIPGYKPAKALAAQLGIK